MVSKRGLEQILSDNGFSYYKHPNKSYDTLIIDNIEIYKMYQDMIYVDVTQYEEEDFRIYINFKDNKYIDISNLCIDLSTYFHVHEGNIQCLKIALNKNNFINELHRLNSVGLNIKGYIS